MTATDSPCRNMEAQQPSATAPPGLSQSLIARVTGGSYLEPDQLEKVQAWKSALNAGYLYMYMHMYICRVQLHAL